MLGARNATVRGRLAAAALALGAAACTPAAPPPAPAAPAAPPSWESMASARDLWRARPERLRVLLSALELSRPELASVRSAAQRGDTVAAAEALLEHFRGGGSAAWLRLRVEETGRRAPLVVTVPLEGSAAPRLAPARP